MKTAERRARVKVPGKDGPRIEFSRLIMLVLAALPISFSCSATSENEEIGTNSGNATTGAGAGGQGGAASSSSTGNGGFNPGTGGAGPMVDVEVFITADNAYGFGYGDGDSMLNYFGGIENVTAGEIFNCNIGAESYLVPATSAAVGAYLYVVTYADKSTTQGVLGQFARVGSPPVYTGEGAWEVCATGQDFSASSGGPSLAQINEQLTACNAGNTDPSTTSAGWVGATATAGGQIAFGEDNTTPRDQVTPGNEFPIVCDIDDDAKWMWFNWDPVNIVWPTMGSPFIWPGGSANPGKEFLIFRLGAEDIPVVN